MFTKLALLGLFAVLFHDSSAITIGQFQNLTTGIWDDWNNTNPENVRQGAFAMEYGNGNLWLISKRLYRKNGEDPWDPANRGGIVSTNKLSTNNWTHTSYDRLDQQDRHGDKLFSLNGRLFMLTYSNYQRKIGFRKLFFWNDESARWLDTPFEIDPAATTISNNSITYLSLNVPKQTENVAYLVASAHSYATRGSEMSFSKLEVEFRGNVPIKATLKALAREQGAQPSAVFFTAVKDSKLYAFVQHFYSEGYVQENGFAYVVDLTTNVIRNVSLIGAAPPMMFSDDRMFQTEDSILIVGGTQVYGLGQLQDVKDIWSLSLFTLEWKGTNAQVPEPSRWTGTFDQTNKKLYLARLKEGILVSQVS